MITRVLLAAILAGIVAGLAVSVVQEWRTTPLILEAEKYETAVRQEPAEDPQASQTPAADSWAPADGLERTAYTTVFNVLFGVAYALVASATVLLTRLPLTAGNGALWGLAGFAAFILAPSAGLPPELPGMPAADLGARQLWWWWTVAATAGGIGVIALVRHLAWKAAAIAFMALPHLVGAPHPAVQDAVVPAALVNAFAVNSLATSAIFWVVLGVSLGVLLTRGVPAAQTG